MNEQQKVIGFIDDAEHECNAFREVMEDNTNYHIVVASETDKFLKRLENEKEVHLLLFDLYFPIPGKDPKSVLTEQELREKTKSLLEICNDFYKQGTSDAQMLFGDLIRRESDAILVDILDHYDQGRDGGLKIIQEVIVHYPRVPRAFLSRKRTADDIEYCLDAGALKVLLKPPPPDPRKSKKPYEMVLSGWREKKADYIKEFEHLMSLDVMERYLTYIEQKLDNVTEEALPQPLKNKMITKVAEAKIQWLNSGDKKSIRSKLNDYPLPKFVSQFIWKLINSILDNPD